VPVLQSTPHGVTDSVRPPEFSRAERTRVLVMAAGGSVVVSYAAVAALLALIAATATHAAFSTAGVLTAAAPAWLTGHHVPLRFSSGQLAVLPLLPTALLMLLIAKTAASTADRLGLFEPLQARSVVFSITGAHAVVGGTIALLMGEGPVRATPAVAFFGCAAVSGVAATLGVARRCGLVEVVLERLDPVARRGLRTAITAMFALTAAGAMVLVLGLLVSWSTASALFGQAGPSFGDGLGMWLLCLGYLPNAVVGGLSFAAGSGVSIGATSISPTHFVGGPIPAVPLLAALPERQGSLLPIVFVLPLVIGLGAGWCCSDVADRPAARVRAVVVTAVASATGCLVLAATAGGRFADGPFNPVTMPAGLLAVLVLGWIAVPGALVAWFAGPRPKRAPVEAPGEEQLLVEEDLDELDEDDEDVHDEELGEPPEDEEHFVDEDPEDGEFPDDELVDDELADGEAVDDGDDEDGPEEDLTGKAE
jgi:hypothetical protein